MPVTITAKIISFSLLVVAKLRVQKFFNLTSYLLVNQAGVIENFSSSCLLLFAELLEIKGVHLDSILPGLFRNRETFLARENIPLEKENVAISISQFDNIHFEVSEVKYRPEVPLFYIYKIMHKQLTLESWRTEQMGRDNSPLSRRTKLIFSIEPSKDRLVATFCNPVHRAV